MNYSNKEFCAQPLRLVWILYFQEAKVEKKIEFKGINSLKIMEFNVFNFE